MSSKAEDITGFFVMAGAALIPTWITPNLRFKNSAVLDYKGLVGSLRRHEFRVGERVAPAIGQPVEAVLGFYEKASFDSPTRGRNAVCQLEFKVLCKNRSRRKLGCSGFSEN